MCSRGRAAGEADDRAAGSLVPVRGAQADERRHEIDSARVGNRQGEVFDLGGRADHLQAVAEPLHDGAGDEDRAFQAIGDLVAEAPADRRDQAVLRGDRFVARVQQQEAARAVGVLRAARLEAGLAEGGRLLVADERGDRNALAEEGAVGLAVDGARRLDLGQHGPRDVEDPQQFVVPVERVDVVDQRAAGVAVIGDVPFAAGEPPGQKGVDGAEQDFAFFRPRAQAGDRVEQVGDLGAGEIGVDDEARLVAERLFVAVGLEAIAQAGRHAALPDDGVGDRFAARSFPEDRRFPLVGDADGGHVARPAARF